MLLVFGFFTVLEPGGHPAKEGFDLLPEHPNSHQHSCEGSDDSLNDKAASAWVDVGVSYARQA